MNNLLIDAKNYLIQLISQGIEYPEAHTQTCIKFKVDGDELSKLYDDAY